MDTLETLYFPDTVIATDGQSPLFLFFNLVHLLQPVETDETDSPAAGPSDTFMDRRFCQVHTPAPLGADRERFLRLVSDIQNRKDDYAAQLSALTVASLSAPKGSNGDSRHEIITSLFAAPDSDPAAEEHEAARQAELWQARLVLAIGEILDREEEAITDALNLLNQSKTKMFDRLLGKDEDFEDEDLFSDLEQLQGNVTVPRPGMIKSRLKAWLSLYRSGTLPDWRLWTTTRPEAADILLEMYEKKTGKVPELFWQLELPVATGAELQEHMEKIETFREEAAPFFSEIALKFNAIIQRQQSGVSATKSYLPDGDIMKNQWTALLDEHFPEELYNRAPFRFYLLQGLGFQDLAAHEGARSPEGGAKHCILAVFG
jgi:hypothetical protein